MSGYIRQSAGVILDEAVVEAQDLNNEFNALRDAFDNTTGHKHDGTVGEGPQLNLTTSVLGQLPVINGGTGANSAASARTNLGVAIGSNVQAYDAGLQSISGLTTLADRMIYTTALDVYAVTALTPFARTLLDDVDASTFLSTLGVSTFIKTLLDDTDAATVRTTLDVPSNANLMTTNTNLSSHISNTSNPHNVTKVQVGLGDVDNTSDANKPVSLATQTALNLKADKATNWRRVAFYDFAATPLSAITQVFDVTDSQYRITYQGLGATSDCNLTLRVAATSGDALISTTNYVEQSSDRFDAGGTGGSFVNGTAGMNIGIIPGTIGLATGYFIGGLGGTNILPVSSGFYRGYIQASNTHITGTKTGYYNLGGRKNKLGIITSNGANLSLGTLLIEVI